MLDNDFHQNHRQPLVNYPPLIQSQTMHNITNQSQPFCNNPLTNTPQFGNNLNIQSNMQAKTIPPTPPPDTSSRCMTPSNIKPGIYYYLILITIKMKVC